MSLIIFPDNFDKIMLEKKNYQIAKNIELKHKKEMLIENNVKIFASDVNKVIEQITTTEHGESIIVNSIKKYDFFDIQHLPLYQQIISELQNKYFEIVMDKISYEEQTSKNDNISIHYHNDFLNEKNKRIFIVLRTLKDKQVF